MSEIEQSSLEAILAKLMPPLSTAPSTRQYWLVNIGVAPHYADIECASEAQAQRIWAAFRALLGEGIRCGLALVSPPPLPAPLPPPPPPSSSPSPSTPPAAPQEPAPPRSQLINIEELAGALGISKATLHRMRIMGKLPRELVLSSTCVRWRAEEISDWIAAGCPAQKEWEARKGARKK